MKEDIMMLHIGEKFSSSFNELRGSDNVNEESDCCGAMLFKTFIDCWGILDIKTGGFNEDLVFYVF
jgi:hypothetical protein